MTWSCTPHLVLTLIVPDTRLLILARDLTLPSVCCFSTFSARPILTLAWPWLCFGSCICTFAAWLIPTLACLTTQDPASTCLQTCLLSVVPLLLRCLCFSQLISLPAARLLLHGFSSQDLLQGARATLFPVISCYHLQDRRCMGKPSRQLDPNQVCDSNMQIDVSYLFPRKYNCSILIQASWCIWGTSHHNR